MPLDILDQLNNEKNNLISSETNSEVNELIADSLQKVIDKAKESIESYEILERVVGSFNVSGKSLSDNLGVIISTFDALNNSVKTTTDSASSLKKAYGSNIFGGTVRGAENLIDKLNKIQENVISPKSIGNIFQDSILGGKEFLSTIDDIKSKLLEISSMNISADVKFGGLPKFETGGMVGGTSKTGDKILARLNSGEWVLTERQMENVAKMLSHKSGKKISSDQVFKMAGGTGDLQSDGNGLPMFAKGGKTPKFNVKSAVDALKIEIDVTEQRELSKNISDSKKQSVKEDFAKLRSTLENLPAHFSRDFAESFEKKFDKWTANGGSGKVEDFLKDKNRAKEVFDKLKTLGNQISNASGSAISNAEKSLNQMGKGDSIDAERLKALSQIIQNDKSINSQNLKRELGSIELSGKDLTTEKILELLQKYLSSTGGKVYASSKNSGIDVYHLLNSQKSKNEIATEQKQKIADEQTAKENARLAELNRVKKITDKDVERQIRKDLGELSRAENVELSKATSQADKDKIVKNYEQKKKAAVEESKSFKSFGESQKIQVAEKIQEKRAKIRKRLGLSEEEFQKTGLDSKLTSKEIEKEKKLLNDKARSALNNKMASFGNKSPKKLNANQSFVAMANEIMAKDKNFGSRLGSLQESGEFNEENIRKVVQSYLSKKENAGLSKQLGKKYGMSSKQIQSDPQSIRETSAILLNQLVELTEKFANLTKEINDFGVSFSNLRVELARQTTSGSDILAGQTTMDWGSKFDLTSKQIAEVFPAVESFIRSNNSSIETVNTIAENLKNATGVLRPQDLQAALTAVQGMTQGQVNAMTGGTTTASDKYGAAFSLMDNPSQLDAAIKASAMGAFTGETPEGLSEGDKALLENNQEMLKTIDNIKFELSKLVPSFMPQLSIMTGFGAGIVKTLATTVGIINGISQTLLAIAIFRKAGGAKSMIGDLASMFKGGKMKFLRQLVHLKHLAQFARVGKLFGGIAKVATPIMKLVPMVGKILALLLNPIGIAAAIAAAIAGLVVWGWIKHKGNKDKETENELRARKDPHKYAEMMANNAKRGLVWNDDMKGVKGLSKQEQAQFEQINKAMTKSLQGLKSYQTLVKQLSSGQFTKFEDEMAKFADLSMKGMSYGGSDAGFGAFASSKSTFATESFRKSMSVINSGLEKLGKGMSVAGKGGMLAEHQLAAYVRLVEQQIKVTEKFVSAVESSIGRYVEIPSVILAELKSKIAQFQFGTAEIGGGTVASTTANINQIINDRQNSMGAALDKFVSDFNSSKEAVTVYKKSQQDKLAVTNKALGTNYSMEDLQNRDVQNSIKNSVANDEAEIAKILKKQNIDITDYSALTLAKNLSEVRNTKEGYDAEKHGEQVNSLFEELDGFIQSGTLKINNADDKSIFGSLKAKRDKGENFTEDEVKNLLDISSRSFSPLLKKHGLKQIQDFKFNKEVDSKLQTSNLQKQLLTINDGKMLEAKFSAKALADLDKIFQEHRRKTQMIINAAMNNANSAFQKIFSEIEGQRVVSRKFSGEGIGGNVLNMLGSAFSGTQTQISELENAREQMKNAQLINSEKLINSSSLGAEVKKDLREYSNLSKRKSELQVEVTEGKTGAKEELASVSSKLEKLEKSFQKQRKVGGFDDLKKTLDRANAENAKSVMDITKQIETVRASFVPKLLKIVEHLAKIETLESKTYDVLSDANKNALKYLGLNGYNINEIRDSGKYSLEFNALSGESRFQQSKETFNQLVSEKGKEDFFKTAIKAIKESGKEVTDKDYKEISLAYSNAVATSGNVAIEDYSKTKQRNADIIKEIERASNEISLQRQESLNLQKELLTTVGAPIQEILKVERENAREAMLQYENAKARHQQMLEQAKNGSVSIKELKESENNMSKARNKILSQIIGAQRAVMEQMFGRLIGTFKGQAGFAGASMYSKYGAGLSVNARGQVVALGSENKGAHNSYGERILGNQMAALGGARKDQLPKTEKDKQIEKVIEMLRRIKPIDYTEQLRKIADTIPLAEKDNKEKSEETTKDNNPNKKAIDNIDKNVEIMAKNVAKPGEKNNPRQTEPNEAENSVGGVAKRVIETTTNITKHIDPTMVSSVVNYATKALGDNEDKSIGQHIVGFLDNQTNGQLGNIIKFAKENEETIMSWVEKITDVTKFIDPASYGVNLAIKSSKNDNNKSLVEENNNKSLAEKNAAAVTTTPNEEKLIGLVESIDKGVAKIADHNVSNFKNYERVGGNYSNNRIAGAYGEGVKNSDVTESKNKLKKLAIEKMNAEKTNDVEKMGSILNDQQSELDCRRAVDILPNLSRKKWDESIRDKEREITFQLTKNGGNNPLGQKYGGLLADKHSVEYQNAKGKLVEEQLDSLKKSSVFDLVHNIDKNVAIMVQGTGIIQNPTTQANGGQSSGFNLENMLGKILEVLSKGGSEHKVTITPAGNLGEWVKVSPKDFVMRKNLTSDSKAAASNQLGTGGK